MSTELATAYLTLIPSLKGASKQISSELAGVNVSGAGAKMGKNLSGGISKGMNLQIIGARLQDLGANISRVGDSLTNSITKPAVGAAAAVGGIAIALGFKRLVGIDTARAKLMALGHDGESITDIMNSALESVKGTSYGLGDAATIAASAVAAGVTAGEDLTKYLSSTADAAAVAGTSLSEMGYIFNQVQTGTVAYTDSLNQLADRGIPIYQWLADELNVTAGEVKKLASEGKISSEEFFKAIDKNIAGAARTIGQNSVMGAWENTKAALGRLGAAFLGAGEDGGGFFGQIQPLLVELMGKMDELAPKAEELGRKFGEFFETLVGHIRSAVSWWESLDQKTQSTILKMVGIAVVLGPVLKIVGSLTSGVGLLLTSFGRLGGSMGSASAGATGLGSAVSRLAGPIALVVAAIAGMWTNSEKFRTSVEALGASAATAFEEVYAALQPTLALIGEQWGPLMKSLGDSMADVFESLLPTIESVVSALGTVIEALTPVINFLLLTFIGALGSAAQTVSQVITYISGTVQWLAGNLQDYVNMISALFRGDWSAAWGYAKSIASRNLQQLKDTVKVVWDIIVGYFRTAGAQVEAITGVSISDVKAAFSRGLTNMKKAALDRLNAIVNDFRNFKSRVKAAFGNPSGLLRGVGRAIIDGLWAGIKSGIGKIEAGLRDLTSKIPDWKGPKEKTGNF